MSAKAIGPFTLLSSLESVKRLFPSAEITTYAANLKNGKTVYVDYKGFHISYCKDLPQDIWIDLQKFPENCLFYKGKNISPQASIKKNRKLLGGCKTTVFRDGGFFYECEKGLKIGVSFDHSNQQHVDQIRIGSSNCSQNLRTVFSKNLDLN